MTATMTPETKKGNGERQPQQEIALATPKPNALMTRAGIQPQTLEEAYRFAQALARSSIVPAEYQKNADNCLIAIDLAARMNSNWLAIMQHVYVVHGRPGLDANLSIGLVNQSGQFDPIQYEEEGKDTQDPKYRVRAFSKRRGSDLTLYGPWIDWPLVKGEGWFDKSGSKWKTMPDQMFHYRAGAWWQKRHCPEMTLGMPTVDELEDAGERKTVEAKVLEPTNGRQPFGFIEPPTRPPAGEPEPEGAAETAASEKLGPKPGQWVCKDADCNSHGEPFDKPIVVKSGKQAGQKLCPECGGGNIVQVADEPQPTDPFGPDELKEVPDPDPAITTQGQETEKPAAEAPKGKWQCLNSNCKARFPEKIKPCPKCGSALGMKEVK